MKHQYSDLVQARLAKLYAATEKNQFATIPEPGEPNIVSNVGNTVIAETTDLTAEPNRRDTDPNKETTIPSLMAYDRSPVFIGRSLVGSEQGSVTEAEEPEIETLRDAQYVLIVNTQWDSFGAAAGGLDKFVPYKVHGTALLVDIESAKPLGGFNFEATNSEKLEAREYESAASGKTSDAQRVVRADFVKHYREAIANGLKTRWPGSTISF